MKPAHTTYLAIIFLLQGLLLSGQTDVLVGAIRWDAWVGSGHPVGDAVEQTLSPAEYHYRVPFYGQITGASSVDIQGTDQETTDDEISYANYAGIDYFAFVWYHDTCAMSKCRFNYLNSSINSMINYCLILESHRFLNEIGYSELTSHFANPHYQRVMGDRPLFYFFGTDELTSEKISTLRSLCISAGVGNPYIVLLCTGEYLGSKPFGFDAVSMYGVSWLNDGVPYQDLVGTEIMQWEYYRSQGLSVVPHVTTGWDRRPRFDNPVFWELPPSPSNWVQMGTPDEISEHVVDAVNWVNNNPVTCPANAVLVYAWNEFDEGGWLCPTLQQYEGLARIESLHDHINNATGLTAENGAEPGKICLSPNPAKDFVRVSGLIEGWHITDMYGNEKMSGGQTTIDITSLEPGMYLLSSGTSCVKMVVE